MINISECQIFYKIFRNLEMGLRFHVKNTHTKKSRNHNYPKENSVYCMLRIYLIDVVKCYCNLRTSAHNAQKLEQPSINNLALV